MRFLFLLGSYLPHASANGVCAEKIAQALITRGNELCCLAMARYEDPGYEEIDGVKVYRVKNLWHVRVLDWCDRHSTLPCIGILRSAALWSWRIRRLLFFFSWPLSAPLFAWNFYRRAKQICLDNQIDCVISVYQPFESLFALMLLKKYLPYVNAVSYFCDCLSGGVFPCILPSVFCKQMLRKWELHFFDVFDAMIVLKSHEQYYCRLYANTDTTRKIHVSDIPFIRNALMEKLPICQEKHYIASLVYAGSINMPLTDPRYMLEIFTLMDKSCIKLDIYGRNNCGFLFEDKSERDLSGSLNIHSALPHNEILPLLLNADILLNLGSNNPRQIPSKIFEYMALGKPIISFYKYNEEPSIEYLNKYPLALLIKEDWNKIGDNAAIVETFIREKRGMRVPFSEVEALFPQNTPDYTAKLLIEICGGE